MGNPEGFDEQFEPHSHEDEPEEHESTFRHEGKEGESEMLYGREDSSDGGESQQLAQNAEQNTEECDQSSHRSEVI